MPGFLQRISPKKWRGATAGRRARSTAIRCSTTAVRTRARRHRCRRVEARSTQAKKSLWSGGINRPHASQGRRDSTGNREVMPRSTRVRLRHCRINRIGSRSLHACCARRDGCLHRRRVSARCYDDRCETVRNTRVIYDGRRSRYVTTGRSQIGDLTAVERDSHAVVSACKDCGVSKVII